MLEESLLNTTTNKKIRTAPTKIHKYQRFKKAQKPEDAAEAGVIAEEPAGFNAIEIESVWPFAFIVACFEPWVENPALVPSKVMDFEVPGAKESILIPETISPENWTPLIRTFPKDEISAGIFADTITPFTAEVVLFATETIK